MSGRMLVTFAALVFWLMPAVAPAVPLFPLQLGAYTQYDGSDLSGHTWEASIWVVAQNINLNSQTYFHIRRQNWNPYGWSPSGPQDSLIRSTDVDAFMSWGGPEWRQFSTTVPGSWQYWFPPGQLETYLEVNVTGPMEVTVPYGYFPQVYENRAIFYEPEHQSNPWYAYLAPGLGHIKEVQTDVPYGNTNTQVLRAVGAKSVSLFPLKTGMRLIYDASNSLDNKWQMTMLVQEQVTFGGHTYFRVLQNNYYYPGHKRELYFRSSTNQAWISYDGVTEHLAFQAAGPGTYWTYPDPWEPGTDYAKIASIEPINVLGGFFLAYRHDGGFPSAPLLVLWTDYVVPGLGIVRRSDSDMMDYAPPLIFTLKSITQGSASPAVDLLLMD